MFAFIKKFFTKAEEVVAPYKVEAEAVVAKVEADVAKVEEEVVAVAKKATVKKATTRKPKAAK